MACRGAVAGRYGMPWGVAGGMACRGAWRGGMACRGAALRVQPDQTYFQNTFANCWTITALTGNLLNMNSATQQQAEEKSVKAFGMTNPRLAVIAKDIKTKMGLAFRKGELTTVYDAGLIESGPYVGQMSHCAFSISHNIMTAIRPSHFRAGALAVARAPRGNKVTTIFQDFEGREIRRDISYSPGKGR